MTAPCAPTTSPPPGSRSRSAPSSCPSAPSSKPATSSRRTWRGGPVAAHVEDIEYPDEGCDLSPSCLNCPLPLCRYDQPGGVRRVQTMARDEEISRLYRQERAPPEVIASLFGISRRTVFRVLARRRSATTGLPSPQPTP
jgi:hypothetical protein